MKTPNRSLAWQASQQDSQIYTQLLTLMQIEKDYVQAPRHGASPRRAIFKEPPSWLLFFKNPHYGQASLFFHQIIAAMSALSTVAMDGVARTFHSETGRIAEALIHYLRSMVDDEESMVFLIKYRRYAAGIGKTMPPHVTSADKAFYNALKAVTNLEYTKRLNAESLGKEPEKRTQDLVVLFKIPLYPLLESIVLSDNVQDVLQTIDEYR